MPGLTPHLAQPTALIHPKVQEGLLAAGQFYEYEVITDPVGKKKYRW
ncbi:MAG TPA: hypothetical protein VD927_00435 [Chryseosolibacter sp.]|nr:hypothetical protein [Chryseosolibacter sp.]